MAWSLPAGLGKRAFTRGSLIAAGLLASALLQAQDSNSYILAARRSGAIEIIDPATLATIGRIHFDLPSKKVVLNGISASADGTMLYVEGPIPNNANGCCVLYSIDLATLKTRQVADIPGTTSRAAFVTSDGITYQVPVMRSSYSLSSRDAVNLYDAAQGKFVRYIAPTGLGQGWWHNGISMDDRFLFYGARGDGTAARLWSVSRDATELGEGVALEPFEEVPNCHGPVERGMTAAAGNLFIYEMFGWKLDRRNSCSGVPGGAWVVDPESGRLLAHVATDFYFSELVADRANGELYGISVGDPGWRKVELLRIDATDGRYCNRACWNQISGASPSRRCEPFPQRTSAPLFT